MPVTVRQPRIMLAVAARRRPRNQGLRADATRSRCRPPRRSDDHPRPQPARVRSSARRRRTGAEDRPAEVHRRTVAAGPDRQCRPRAPTCAVRHPESQHTGSGARLLHPGANGAPACAAAGGERPVDEAGGGSVGAKSGCKANAGADGGDAGRARGLHRAGAAEADPRGLQRAAARRSHGRLLGQPFPRLCREGTDAALPYGCKRDTIRPRVLGKFRDLLGATAESPAMLFYLDNWQSAAAPVPDVRPPSGPEDDGPGTRRLRPATATIADALAGQAPAARSQRNRARADGAAHARRRRRLRRRTCRKSRAPHRLDDRPAASGGSFQFEPRMHDDGEKVVLGHRSIRRRTQGRRAGPRHLAEHPSTAQFISTKLVRRFVSDTPPKRWWTVRRGASGDPRRHPRGPARSRRRRSSSPPRRIERRRKPPSTSSSAQCAPRAPTRGTRCRS